MAEVWPFSDKTVRLLERPPRPGETHHWLARVAMGMAMSGCCTRENCGRFLRDVCRRWVTHRDVPGREIDAAVAFGFDAPKPASRRPSVRWPACDKAERDAAVERCASPLFDGATDTGVSAGEALAGLFGLDETVCGGFVCEVPIANMIEKFWGNNAARAQFVCPNPLKGTEAVLNKAGKPSIRCQANIAYRRWVIAEFDDASLAKADQAKLASVLSCALPLKMVVDSGGKSLHCWFACQGLTERDVAAFFAWAVSLGADPTRWDPCGWVRMPGGLRRRPDGSTVRQKIVYWKANGRGAV
jgi:hypothetical protein